MGRHLFLPRPFANRSTETRPLRGPQKAGVQRWLGTGSLSTLYRLIPSLGKALWGSFVTPAPSKGRLVLSLISELKAGLGVHGPCGSPGPSQSSTHHSLRPGLSPCRETAQHWDMLSVMSSGQRPPDKSRPAFPFPPRTGGQSRVGFRWPFVRHLGRTSSEGLLLSDAGHRVKWKQTFILRPLSLGGPRPAARSSSFPGGRVAEKAARSQVNVCVAPAGELRLWARG